MSLYKSCSIDEQDFFMRLIIIRNKLKSAGIM